MDAFHEDADLSTEQEIEEEDETDDQPKTVKIKVRFGRKRLTREARKIRRRLEHYPDEAEPKAIRTLFKHVNSIHKETRKLDMEAARTISVIFDATPGLSEVKRKAQIEKYIPGVGLESARLAKRVWNSYQDDPDEAEQYGL